MQNILWKKIKNNKIRCIICSHFCELNDENSCAINQKDFKHKTLDNTQVAHNINKCTHTGKCRVHKNINGKLVSLISNTISSYNIDPIEKKPLYHFLPNTNTFSFGTMGCNFDCAWCQNSSIAHPKTENEACKGIKIDTKSIIKACKANQCPSISFTYNEPTVFFELMLECAQKAQEEDIKITMVSNGYQSPQALKILLPYINATNIDLKSFNDATYQKYCNARLKPVLNTLKTVAKSDTWLEVTTLLIPNLNDRTEELTNIAQFIHNELGAHIPWHISAFHPQRNMLTTPRTPKETLIRAYEIGKKTGLQHVYMGNAGITNETKCVSCQTTCITRNTYSTQFFHNLPEKNTIQSNKEESNIAKPLQFTGVCPHCQTQLAGVW